MSLPNVDGVEIRAVPGWKGYAVGNDGTVWTCRRIGRPPGITETWRQLTGTRRGGYRRVILHDGGGGTRTRDVHTLVLETFSGPCPAGMECRHLDGNRSNNSVMNLRWGTRLENVHDSIRHQTHPVARHYGEKHPRAKLTWAVVREIRRLAGTIPQNELARRFGIAQTHVSAIILRRQWKTHET